MEVFEIDGRDEAAYKGQLSTLPLPQYLRRRRLRAIRLCRPEVPRIVAPKRTPVGASTAATSATALQRLDITTVEADVCKPLPVGGPFDSAALNGVLHCLPGPLPRKAVAVANVSAVLAPTGVLFGATILGTSGRHNRTARSILRANNRRGTFDNLGDTPEGLRGILEQSFEQVELEILGSMAIFAATNPRTNPSIL